MCSMRTLKANYFTDVSLDANLEEDVDNDVLLKDVVEAAEDGKSVHHELDDVLALDFHLSWKVMM